jgi:hypothetical protein
MQRTKRGFAVLGATLASVIVLGSGVVRCPSALLFHVPCPMCGSTRAARALLSLDVAGAVRANPLAPAVIVVLALLAARAVILTFRTGAPGALDDGRVGRALVRVLLALLAGQVVVWALRFAGFFGGPVSV